MPLFRKIFPLVLLAGFASPAVAEESHTPGTIDIVGIGEVTALPDMAYITTGVVNEADTARAALSANTETMTQLIAVLKAAGIADIDIQTANFSVQPQYVYSDLKNSTGHNLPPKIGGYKISNSVTIRIRALDNLGTVLDQVVTVGSNTINNVSFAVSETLPLFTEARKRAMANAIEKAQLYATAADVSLGQVINISETGGYVPQPVAMMERSMKMAMDAGAPVPMQSGELTYDISISVRWELDQ